MAEVLIIGESIGGQPKTRYWTPDGRELLKSPCMRTTSNGGVRDANYDFGWLPVKPTVLKPYCPNCDKWHDTEEEIKECGKRKKAMEAKYTKLAKKQIKTEGKDVETLTKQVEELTALVKKLMKE